MIAETFYDKCFRRINDVLARISMRSGFNLNRPSYVCLKMTMKCNSRCLHCDIWKMEYGEEELTTANWLALLGSLKKWLGKTRIVMTGGEALLSKDLPLILEHSRNLGLRVELLTNGLIIDRSMADTLMKIGLEQITISLDGCTAATHDRFRGGEGFFEKTVAALHHLREAREKSGQDTVILLKTVTSSNNMAELTDLAALADSLGFHIRYQPIEQNYGDERDFDWYKKSEFWIHDNVGLQQVIKRLIEMRHAGCQIENTPQELMTIIEYFSNPETMMSAIQNHDYRADRRYCRHAVGNFVVSPNGDVKMCFSMPSIGNVSVDEPRLLWKKRPRCWARACQYQ